MNRQMRFTLGRTIDISSRTNQLILAISTLAFVISFGFQLLRGDLFVDSFIINIFFALIIFLCWALAREMYPQAEYAALAAALLCSGVVAWFGVIPETILLLGWFVLLLRFLNQITGQDASLLDRGILFGVSLLNTFVFSWIFFWLLALVFAVQYMLSNKQRDLGFLIAGFFGGLILMLYQGTQVKRQDIDFLSLFIVILSFLLFFILIWRKQSNRILDDISHKPVPQQRIVSAQLISVLFSLVLLLWFGVYGFLLLIPIWCVIVSALVFSLMQFTKKIDIQ